MQRAIHGIGRLDGAGAQCGVQQVSVIGERSVVRSPDAVSRRERSDLHAVLGQRAGLVDAKNAHGAERLDDRGASREYVVAREPPGAERQENDQHHWEFFGRERDGQRQPGEPRFDPVATKIPIGNSDEDAEGERGGPEPADDATHRTLQGRLTLLDRR